MSELEEVQQLKEDIETLRRRRDEAEGATKQLMKDLKDLGYATPQIAKAELQRLEDSSQSTLAQVEKLEIAWRKKYQELIDAN